MSPQMEDRQRDGQESGDLTPEPSGNLDTWEIVTDSSSIYGHAKSRLQSYMHKRGEAASGGDSLAQRVPLQISRTAAEACLPINLVVVDAQRRVVFISHGWAQPACSSTQHSPFEPADQLGLSGSSEAHISGTPPGAGLLQAIMGVPWPMPVEYPEDGRYNTLLQISIGQEEVDDVITRDIHRTFPEHPQFGTAQGQQLLFKVLKAYSLHDLEVRCRCCMPHPSWLQVRRNQTSLWHCLAVLPASRP